jgi:hypothetical protein
MLNSGISASGAGSRDPTMQEKEDPCREGRRTENDDRYLRIYLAWYSIARLDTRTMQVKKLWPEDRTSEAEACGKEEIPKSRDSHLPTGTTTAGG